MNDLSEEINWEAIYSQTNPVEVGKRINAIRSEIGMSMEILADGISKSRSTVSRIERGTQELTIGLLFEISQILNVSYLELLVD